MYDMTIKRNSSSADLLWFCQHSRVYTHGPRYKPCTSNSDIPLVATDRGGLITYHGPGQLVVYFLWDLPRMQLSVHDLVNGIERSILKVLDKFHIQGELLPLLEGFLLMVKR